LNRQLKPIVIIGILILVIWIVSKIYNNKIENDIAENKSTTYAKVYDVEYVGKNKVFRYKFKYDNKIYLGDAPAEKINFEILNKYYKIDFSTEEPEKNRINLNAEITDESIIERTGL